MRVASSWVASLQVASLQVASQRVASLRVASPRVASLRQLRVVSLRSELLPTSHAGVDLDIKDFSLYDKGLLESLFSVPWLDDCNLRSRMGTIQTKQRLKEVLGSGKSSQKFVFWVNITSF